MHPLYLAAEPLVVGGELAVAMCALDEAFLDERQARVVVQEERGGVKAEPALRLLYPLVEQLDLRVGDRTQDNGETVARSARLFEDVENHPGAREVLLVQPREHNKVVGEAAHA